jgi:multidrug efflux pump subunit AcrA (membrane-fusion protein)
MNRNLRDLRLFAFLIGLSAALFAFKVHAGPGHDDSSIQVQGDAPKRQADGNLFIPKPAQRQLHVMTAPGQSGEYAKTYDLAGKVIMDPNFGGKVQAIVAGRITPGPNGFPLPGQKVNKGDVLAYVTPEAGSGKSRSLAESRLKRLRELSDTVPRKTIEEAEAAVANEELRAPVSGLISTTGIVSGQVVQERDLIFEVVNPSRLLIEVLAYDPNLAKNIADGKVEVNGKVIKLSYLGGGQTLREQALPLTFSAKSDDLQYLPIGQPLRVFVNTNTKVLGNKVPTKSLVKSGSNQTIVWVKGNPETFEPRVVVYEPLDGQSIVITSGIKDGDRVVTDGASLINQIR